MRQLKTRIAPTPSGYLHAGNALNFLLIRALARSMGASVLLRIDDLDAARARPEYLDDIFRSLEWLDITWDEGPTGPDDFLRNWSQHGRLDRYRALLDQLRDRGKLFACTCSRRTVTACTCRARDIDLDPSDVTWRLRTDAPYPITINELPNDHRIIDMAIVMRDPVLRQRNGLPTYQVASLADDVDHGIDLIVRGEDLLPSTACQMRIAGLLDLQQFTAARFIHHPLLTDTEGRKLSKSEGASSLKAMRESGVDPTTLHALAADRLRRWWPGASAPPPSSSGG